MLFRRDINTKVVSYLGTDNIIVLHGARQVGKTHILYYLKNKLEEDKKQTHYLDLEDSRFIDLLNKGADAFLQYLRGEGYDLDAIQKSSEKLYVFIDEIQYLDNPSPFLKLLGDHHKYIQLIVSGSSSFDIKSKFSDSLVGRTVNFDIYNLSFSEFIRFKQKKYHLSDLSVVHKIEVEQLYYEYVLYGGYPKVVLEDDLEKKDRYLQQIVDTYVRKDIRDLADVRDIHKFNNLLKVLAARSGQLLNVTALSDVCGIAKQTVEEYLFIMEQTYIIKLLPPFSSSATVEVVRTPKVFFYDTGLLQILWLRALQNNVLGSMFETSVFAELVKKFGNGNLHYWRTKNKNEIDFILSQRQEYIPIEVKESFRQIRGKNMALFHEKYKPRCSYFVGIKGEKQENCVYPWELYTHR